MASHTTITAILDAAERLFAGAGYDKTSIREITREAGVNVAAIHYHFGDKAAVLRAVTDRIITPMNARRLAMLDLVEAAAPGSPPTAEVLEAFIRPDIETLQGLQRRGPTVAHFIGRVYGDQTPWIQEMAFEQFGPVGQRFGAALLRANPDLDAGEIEWRVTRVVALLIHSFATWPPDGMTPDGAELTIRRLVGFTAAGLENTYEGAGEE